MLVHLIYNEPPSTAQQREVILEVPIALGRDSARMPTEIEGRRTAQVVFNPNITNVSRFHAVIDWQNEELIVIDQNTKHGTFVNGTRQSRSALKSGDILKIGSYQIQITFKKPDSEVKKTTSLPTGSFIGFDLETGLLNSTILHILSPSAASSKEFPPSFFSREKFISVSDIHATKLKVQETEYLAIGAGLGSYIWVDLLRIYGAKPEKIIALGLDSKPYARYKQLCLNSQIPLHERLRSNSDSCPDNIWGWPSYALREAWSDLGKVEISKALKKLWQVFAEPVFAQTYTPRAGNVFDSIDRETNRIGWNKIFQYGRVLGIRKTEDGRYCIAYSGKDHNHAFILARYVHLATGYPAITFLDDLQKYREKTRDFNSVVNAYEDHKHIYEHLKNRGGIIVLRGRGIVASRILQRVYEIRQTNRSIEVIHLMRSPKSKGNEFPPARRRIENHYEFQPFNWPKACWGGELRDILEKADPSQRQSLLEQWGGTTTADRNDWKRIIKEGMAQAWYKITFGEVEGVERDENNQLLTHIQELDISGLNREKKSTIPADFIIDCTGLDAQVEASPLFRDLVKHYGLTLNTLKKQGNRLFVENDFEIKGMRNQTGLMYAAGAITLGGPYAAVDSFLGLQYAALCSVKSLADRGSLGLNTLTPVNSLIQWLKWIINKAP